MANLHGVEVVYGQRLHVDPFVRTNCPNLKAARIAYTEMQQSKVTGGISQAFQDALTAERKAVIGCCK